LLGAAAARAETIEHERDAPSWRRCRPGRLAGRVGGDHRLISIGCRTSVRFGYEALHPRRTSRHRRAPHRAKLEKAAAFAFAAAVMTFSGLKHAREPGIARLSAVAGVTPEGAS